VFSNADEMSRYVLVVPAATAVAVAYFMVMARQFVFRERSPKREDDQEAKNAGE
jgi:hypothetical protein